MKWFKHFSNAHLSNSLEDLINDFGYEGYGRYWRLLEILNESFDGETCFFKIHKRTIRTSLRFRSALQTDSFVVAIGLQAGYKVVVSENHYEIEAPILLELKNRDFKRARTDRVTDTSKNKIKNKNKIKSNSAVTPSPKKACNETIEIVDYLNTKLGSKFKPTSKETIKLIQGRLKEDFSIQDFKTVIDNKYSTWHNDDKMRTYLRPSTLFRGGKFEEYLNETIPETHEDRLAKFFADAANG